MKQNKKWKSLMLLFLAAVIWGIAFVAQTVGMDYVGPYTFNGVRCLLGGIVLLPVIYFFDKKKPVEVKEQEDKKALWLGGTICGLCLCTASSLQQIGLQYTTAGKAGFLTALYIIIVPILGLFLGKKCSPFVAVSIVLATIGLYLLSIRDGFQIGQGDGYVMLCALVFSIHILTIDHFSPKCDGVKLSCVQFFVSGVIATVIALIVEKPELTQILAAWLPIAYAGFLSCGVAYTLQIIGQKGINPTVASLVLSLESVVSVLSAWVLLNQTLSGRELIGCAIMFIAIILAQVNFKTRK